MVVPAIRQRNERMGINEERELLLLSADLHPSLALRINRTQADKSILLLMRARRLICLDWNVISDQTGILGVVRSGEILKTFFGWDRLI